MKTLEGKVYALERVKRCNNPGCRDYHWRFFSETFQRMILTKKLFGTDVVDEIDRLKYEGHKTHEETQQILEDGDVQVSYGGVT